MRIRSPVHTRSKSADVIAIFACPRQLYTGMNGIPLQSSSIVVPNNDPGMLIPITNNQVIDYIKHESANLRQVMETFEIFYDNIELVNERFNPQVKLTSRDGNIYVINLETYLQNEIQNYCIKKSKEMM